MDNIVKIGDLAPEIPPSNIVALNAECASELEITLRKTDAYKRCPGQHIHVETDSEMRTLKCTHCGCIVDAFDYILAWAQEGERRMTALKSIEIKRKINQAEHDDLARKIVNMRAQLKRGGMPQTPEEKNVYDMRRWNPHKELQPPAEGG